jgi:hypothetical protein
MTRRPRILTVEQADAEIESLSWLRGAGSPNREVRKLFDCYAVVRASLHRQPGDEKKPGFAERIDKQRK